jgi:hypothetical protein
MSDAFAIARSAILSLGGGYLLVLFQRYVGSAFLTQFLTTNLLTLLVALLAINSATMGTVLSKLRDICDANAKARFGATRKQMKIALCEHIALIVFATLLLTLQGSRLAQTLEPDFQTFMEASIAGAFCYSLLLLYDSASSIFVLLRTE